MELHKLIRKIKHYKGKIYIANLTYAEINFLLQNNFKLNSRDYGKQEHQRELNHIQTQLDKGTGGKHTFYFYPPSNLKLPQNST